jgi:D-alanyl-D-alanine carboxypeptidase
VPRLPGLLVVLVLGASCTNVVGEDPPSLTPSPSETILATPTATPSPTPTPSPTATPTPSPSPSPTPTPTAVPRTPTPTQAGRQPYCAVADVLTPIREYERHAATFLDWTYALPNSYAPPDLVAAADGAEPRISAFGSAGFAPRAADRLITQGDPEYAQILAGDRIALVRRVIFADLLALQDAAARAGLRLVVVSAFRSFLEQEATFNYWVSVGGYEQALRTSARPGHSEHQLGTTIDFGDGRAAPWEYADWATTPTGAWLAQHAAEYGFLMTLPKGKSDVTCYDYEPWHYRWVGRDVAAQVRGTGLALREYQRGPR